MAFLTNAYVYGVYIQNELVYVGQTTQPIQDRIDSHIQRCHNKELKEALLSNYYDFKILYESHDIIGQDTLNSIEEALIITNQPKYNKCGVTMPYHAYANKTAFSGGGLATQLSQKHYYSNIDIQQLLQQNAQISCAYICLKDDYAATFFSEAFTTLSLKEQEECLQYTFGKINKYNEMSFHGTKGFRQQTYCIKESDGTLRFPTLQEKANGIPKTKIQNCHIVFLFKEEDEYKKDFDNLIQQNETISQTLSPEQQMDYWLCNSMETARIQEAFDNRKQNIYKYYPLKIVSIQGQEDLKHQYFYIDTWQTSEFE